MMHNTEKTSKQHNPPV